MASPQSNHERNSELLLKAIGDRDLDLIEELIAAKNVNINALEELGNSAISYSCLYGNVPITKLLLKNNKVVNTRNSHGSTPLKKAAKCGGVEICTLLIMAGAVVDKTTYQKSVSMQYRIDPDILKSINSALKEPSALIKQTLSNYLPEKMRKIINNYVYYIPFQNPQEDNA